MVVSSITIVLIVIVVIIFIAMMVAIFKLLKLLNETKTKAEAMTEEERESYAPSDEENSSTM